MRPPKSSTSPRAIDSPRPAPPCLRGASGDGRQADTVTVGAVRIRARHALPAIGRKRRCATGPRRIRTALRSVTRGQRSVPRAPRLSVTRSRQRGCPRNYPYHSTPPPFLAESPRNCLSSCRRRHCRLACWTSFVRCGSLHGTPLDRQPGKRPSLQRGHLTGWQVPRFYRQNRNLSPRGGHWRNSSRHHFRRREYPSCELVS